MVVGQLNRVFMLGAFKFRYIQAGEAIPMFYGRTSESFFYKLDKKGNDKTS
jgi:hypothetical protein